MFRWTVPALLAPGLVIGLACSNSADDEGAADETGAAEITALPSADADEDVWELCERIGTSRDWLEEPPIEKSNYVFRCFQGEALECEAGATGGACSKVTDEEPEGLAQYCRENTDDPEPPFSVVGHGPTTKIWTCIDGQPAGSPNAAFDPADYDEAGFDTSEWSAVSTPKP